MSAPAFRYTTRLTVTGEADPQLPARILGIITTLNRLPLHFACSAPDEHHCHIDMVVEGGDEGFSVRLAALARRIPSVIEATGSLRASC